jgi:hypothetical protein
VGENHIMFFFYLSLRITFIGRKNSFECDNPLFLLYNLMEAPNPQSFGYNQKEAKTPYVLRLQPEGSYNHLSLPRPATLK